MLHSVNPAWAGCLFIALILSSCSDEDTTSSGAGTDAGTDAGPDMTDWNLGCGKPGDTGNAKGIGKFCTSSSECDPAPFCTGAFDPTVHYCTAFCDATEDVPSKCGEDTACECYMGACACVLLTCLATYSGSTTGGGQGGSAGGAGGLGGQAGGSAGRAGAGGAGGSGG